MPSKSDKEKKTVKKAVPAADELESAKKVSSRPKKQEEDDEDDDDIDVDATATPKKGKKPSASKTKDDDDSDVEESGEEEVDEWDKVEEEENWDPDFDEFDLPRSKDKKFNLPKKGKESEEDDLGGLEDFKEMDLFDDRLEDEDDDF